MVVAGSGSAETPRAFYSCLCSLVSAESIVARKGRMDVFFTLGFLDLGEYSAQAIERGRVY